MRCPCKSNKEFEQCCQPIIQGQIKANSPEQLMRSRYSAYAVGNAEYIIKTYSKISRSKQSLNDIKTWAEQCQWVNLIIHQSNNTHVEFSAYFIEENELYVLRENSEFHQEENCWVYHTGNIIENAQLDKVKRNEPCPCQQSKKFKQCCGRFLG